MDERSYVDSVFHPQIFTEEQIEEIPGYAEQYGIRSFKFYMSGMPGIVKSVTDDVLLHGFRTVASLGPDAVACVHCETGALIDARAQRTEDAQARRHAEGLGGCASRHRRGARDPDRALSRQGRRRASLRRPPLQPSGAGGGARTRAAPACSSRSRRRRPISASTASIPTASWSRWSRRCARPSTRPRCGKGFLEGSINTVGTDNTSRARATKKPEAGLHGARPGLPALGTHLPALLHYGRLRGVPLEVLVERATRVPARVYGIYPQKGTIAVGSDADLVVVDLEMEKRRARGRPAGHVGLLAVRRQDAASGWPVATIKAGKIIARDGKIVGKANGRYLPRKPAPASTFRMVQKRAGVRQENNGD